MALCHQQDISAVFISARQGRLSEAFVRYLAVNPAACRSGTELAVSRYGEWLPVMTKWLGRQLLQVNLRRSLGDHA